MSNAAKYLKFEQVAACAALWTKSGNALAA
jgi:hypothetical protein